MRVPIGWDLAHSLAEPTLFIRCPLFASESVHLSSALRFGALLNPKSKRKTGINGIG